MSIQIQMSLLDMFFTVTCFNVFNYSSEGCPRIGDAHPDVLVIPEYVP